MYLSAKSLEAIIKEYSGMAPDILVLWRPVLVNKSLLSRLKSLGCPIHIINNDDPFSSIRLAPNIANWLHLRLRWYHYKRILPLCEFVGFIDQLL